MAGKDTNISTLATNISDGIENRLKDLHTSMPGIVETFDAATQLVSVQPAVQRIMKTDDGEKEILTPTNLPILINVPVQFAKAGGFALTFPIVAGDECLLVFCERSIDRWHQFGGVQQPAARRFHALSDAVAIVGLPSLANKLTGYNTADVELRNDAGTSFISIKADGSIEVETPTKVTVTGGTEVIVDAPIVTVNASTSVTVTSPLTTFVGNVIVTGLLTTGTLAVTSVTTPAQFDGDLQVDGATTLSATVTSNGKDLSDTHTHNGSATAPSGPVSDTGTVV